MVGSRAEVRSTIWQSDSPRRGLRRCGRRFEVIRQLVEIGPKSEEIVTPLVEPTNLELIRKIAAAPPIPQLIKFFGLCGYHVARVGPVAIARWGKRGGRCFDGPVHSRGPIFGSDAPSAQKAGCRRNHRSEEWLHTHPLPPEDERWALS